MSERTRGLFCKEQISSGSLCVDFVISLDPREKKIIFEKKKTLMNRENSVSNGKKVLQIFVQFEIHKTKIITEIFL
ncbi:hypothetical protein BpHYR1_032610 [Brachionus plicatilis]|uniref:Uncharacterized protein n=1 Tax=Brachionus plicatilis TaxID=10195 RepID=A0A3M7QYU1_BRAPC|nr:hypothetical protein BpHYR1_032610 [Brachionus plicatilis]